MFKRIIFFLWIACAMAAGENSITGEDLPDIEIRIQARPGPISVVRFPTAAAQCAPIVLGNDKWVQVVYRQNQLSNGNREQSFTFTVMDTRVTQNNIVAEVNRQRTVMGRPPITQGFLTHLASYLQDPLVASVCLREEWKENGQVVHSLMDPARIIEGKFVDMNGRILKLKLRFHSVLSCHAFHLSFTKLQGFEYAITPEQLGNAISKFTRVAFSEARIKSIENRLTQPDGESRVGMYLHTDPVTGQPKKTATIFGGSITGVNVIEFWGAEDFPWGHLEDSRDRKRVSDPRKLNGFITDDENNLLDVELILHWTRDPWTSKINIARNSEGKVKDAASKLDEILLNLLCQGARPEVLKEILEKVYQVPIGHVNEFSLTESDLEGQQLRLI